MTLVRSRSDTISNNNITNNTKISESQYVVTVTECLSDHVECTEYYVDTVTGKYQILCKCLCHVDKIEEFDPVK